MVLGYLLIRIVSRQSRRKLQHAQLLKDGVIELKNGLLSAETTNSNNKHAPLFS
jgi:hypothetical protein